MSIANLLKLCWNYLQGTQVAVIAAFTVSGGVIGVIHWCNIIIKELFARCDAWVMGSVLPSSVSFAPLGVANYFVPIDTCCTLTTVLMAAVITSATIRIIKSFIPTVA